MAHVNDIWGEHGNGVYMRPEDWLRLVQPVVADLRKDNDK